MNILLFGASGQLGHDIQKELSEFEIDCFSSKEFDFASDKKIKLNKTYDLVINCMAMTNTGLCEDEEELALKLNSDRVGEIAEYCHKHDIPLFHFSTDYVFDGASQIAFTEESKTNPLSVYGKSKLAGEVEAFLKHDKVFVFRVSSLYGIGGNNFVKTILGKAREGNELTIVNDQFMSPTHSLDVARAVKTFIKTKNTDYGIYHASNTGVCSWFEFTKEILSVAGLDVPVKEVSYTDFPAKLERPVYSELDTTKIKKYFDMPKWQDSLLEFMSLMGETK